MAKKVNLILKPKVNLVLKPKTASQGPINPFKTSLAMNKSTKNGKKA